MIKYAYNPIKNHDVPLFSVGPISTSHQHYNSRWSKLSNEAYIFLTLDPVKHSKIPVSLKITESQ